MKKFKLTKIEYNFLKVVSVVYNRWYPVSWLLEDIIDEGAYIARNQNGTIALYKDKPYKQSDSWVMECRDNYIPLNAEYFPHISWEDEEPYHVLDLLKLEVEK